MNRNQNNPARREERRQMVFISYSRENREEAERLVTGLNAAGYDPWLDTVSIKVGAEWENEIEKTFSGRMP